MVRGPAARRRAGGAPRPPRAPPGRLLVRSDPPWALQSPGPAPSPQPGARAAHRSGACAQGPGPGAQATRRHPTEPARAPRNSPGSGGPLGIIPSRAGRQLPGDGAHAASGPLLPGGRGSRSGTRGAAGGRGPEWPSAGCPPAAAAAAVEASAAQEGAGDHVPRGGGRSQARGWAIPLRGAGRGFQETQTLRQEIGILTKHSRPAAAPRRGAPASLNPWPAGAQAGTGGVSDTPGGPPARQPGRGLRPPAPGGRWKRRPVSGYNLGLGRCLSKAPNDRKGSLPLSHPVEDELAGSKPCPALSVKEMTLPGCPLSLRTLC